MVPALGVTLLFSSVMLPLFGYPYVDVTGTLVQELVILTGWLLGLAAWKDSERMLAAESYGVSSA